MANLENDELGLIDVEGDGDYDVLRATLSSNGTRLTLLARDRRRGFECAFDGKLRTGKDEPSGVAEFRKAVLKSN
jgi:hypothetical protein